ncbi:MAG: O-antigen ligase family protein [Armatimonadetes bacterium]|nr:O-antigen ligase family protein [Armatimonadota bacterium]
MKKIEPGLLLLLVATFLLIVAGGHVTLDARPASGTSIGIVLTLAAALLTVGGAFFATRARTEYDGPIGGGMLLIAGGIVVHDVVYTMLTGKGLLTGGDMFAAIRLLAGLAVFGGLAHMLVTRRVVQMPGAWYGGLVVLVVASMGASLVVSEFVAVSLDGWQYWLLYAAGFYLAVASLGRVRGPRLLVETVVAGASFVALKGIVEFLYMRADAPSHRIFADWSNPNALAGLFVVALPLALALACTSKRWRLGASVAGGAVLVAALALTQSKGGLLVAPIGIATFLFAALMWRRGKRVLWGVAPLVAGALIVGGLQLTAVKSDAGAAETAPLQRVTRAGAEQVQSTEFRKLLWKGAIDLFSQQPVGYGAGTYRFHSAKSGLTEQTHLTHQSFLQLAVEGGALAVVGMILLGLAWTFRMCRGWRALDTDRNVLRAGVLAAVVACGANGFVESNLFYLGTGFLMFVLLGAGLQLAADGSSPESLPKGLRVMVAVLCCGVPLALCVWSARLEATKSAALAAGFAQDREALEAALEDLASLGAFDDESWYLRARLIARPEQETLALLEGAVARGPRTRHLRVLAAAQHRAGDTPEALATLARALRYDPNNLRTLLLKMQTERASGSTDAAVATAIAIIAVEDTDYLKVRALPEFVPTEPFQARLFLASEEEDDGERARLLRAAVEGYARYAAATIPRVLQMATVDRDFAGETVASATAKMAEAREAAVELEELYREMGDDQSADEVRALAVGLSMD